MLRLAAKPMLLIFLGVICFSSTPVYAAWPDRPITMIVPFAAGGGTDFNARVVAKILEENLKVSINCVNRTGGSGVIGHKAIADAEPDGYTIGYLAVELSMMHWAGLTDLDYRQITPIAQLTSVGGGLFVQASSAYKSADDVMKAIKSNPGKMKASGSGIGGIWHLALAGMVESMGIKANTVIWVPNQGAAPAIQDMVAGGLDMVVCAPQEARAMLDAGRVRGLAYLGEARNPGFSNIPTFKESVGSNFMIEAWGGIGAPKGLPNDIKAKLSLAVKRVYDSNEFKDIMGKAGKGITYKGPDEFAAFLAEMDQNFGKVMKAVELAK
jgi:tripartite-type tricarboxylate transporter receptor subunit TctC